MLFSVYTLGCKLNQLETEAITDSFCREGFTFIPWNALKRCSAQPWLMIINTCTVTSMAEQKARRFIRKLLREHPAMCLIITGCYAQVEQDAISALEVREGRAPERLFVIPGEIKDSLLDLPRLLADAGAVKALLPTLISSWLDTLLSGLVSKETADGAFRLQPENFASHSRAFLKVQDGCDRRCAYCRVSIARGKSRSLGAEEVLKTLTSLEERGFAEAVIAGVNVTQYLDASGANIHGVDTALDLAGLLDFLLSKTETIRLRLSSIEPDWLAAVDFTKILAHPRIRPHFHLSVQSGSAEVIAKMGRPYTPADIERTTALLRSIRQDPFLACDIIAGFPGESEEDFTKTITLCETIGFAWIHAFPFSRRPGTAAYDFPERVSEKDATERVKLLTDLARKGRREYIARWEGKEVEAVIESDENLPKGFVPGVSENYLKLCISYGDEPTPAPGTLARCRIVGNREGAAGNGEQEMGDRVLCLLA